MILVHSKNVQEYAPSEQLRIFYIGFLYYIFI